MTSAALPSRTLPASRPRPGRLRSGELAGLGFLAPFLVFYALFLILPLALAAIMSLFNTSLVIPGLGRFVGLSNYGELFGDTFFWQAMWHTVLFTIVSTPVLVVLPMFLAIAIYRVRRGQWFFRLTFFMPYILPSAVISLIWTWMYEPGYGLIDGTFHFLGLGAPGWLSSPHLVLYSIVIVTIWWTIGFSFVLFLAGLQDIPQNLYEAAELDGASWWTQTRRITIPMLGRTITLVAVLQVIASLKVFDQVYLITQGGGGPNYSARTAIEYIYDQGFTSQRVGYASAASLVLFVVIMAISFAWLAVVRRQEKGV
ncbi:MAG: sugar ABC transporter permease [Solirubrobacterales bacterium]|nr:sugar ABC transporter permease [Solirubrobacterales bacterium]